MNTACSSKTISATHSLLPNSVNSAFLQRSICCCVSRSQGVEQLMERSEHVAADVRSQQDWITDAAGVIGPCICELGGYKGRNFRADSSLFILTSHLKRARVLEVSV
ncbi:unnamed protein product [Caretta caretta]